MAIDKRMPKWRSCLIWSAVGALVYVLAVAASFSLRPEGILGTIFKSEAVTTRIGLGLLFTSVLIGLAMRNLDVNLRNIRNFAIWGAVAIIVSLLARRGFHALVGTAVLDAMGTSETVAAVLGLILLIMAILGGLVVVAAHSRGHFLNAEQADDTRERSRALIYSYVSMAAMGLSLVVLSLAGPGGIFPPIVALMSVLVLLGMVTVLIFALWPLMDELQHAMSRETGNAAFYLIIMIGGGWAMLAHLGFVTAPTPLDWLTMLTLTMFAASFMAVGKRGLLKSR